MSTNNKNAKKKGGGFLARHAKSKGISEADLLKKDIITAEDVLKLSAITDSKYLYDISARV